MTAITLEIAFASVDSLYFRGSRPHAAAGASALTSDFPPPATTFSGSIRTRLGDALGMDWAALRKGVYRQTGPELHDTDLASLMGTADDTGLLEFSAPNVRINGQPLYPVPSVLMKADRGLIKMSLGNAVRTDLGNVRLPVLPEGVHNAKPMDNCWLTHKGMQQYLKGDVPGPDQIVNRDQLVHFESRLGIGRDAHLGTVMSGLLYQTEHLRFEPDVDFTIRVTLPRSAAALLQESIRTNPLQRFGGEGRMAALSATTVEQRSVTLAAPAQPSVLMLLADMLPQNNFKEAPLPGFVPTTLEAGVTCWEGSIEGVSLYRLGVASGKPRRFGGWDIRHNRPRPIQSYIPAGSCFYVQPKGSEDDLRALHGKQIGRRTDFGFGTLLCAA